MPTCTYPTPHHRQREQIGQEPRQSRRAGQELKDCGRGAEAYLRGQHRQGAGVWVFTSSREEVPGGEQPRAEHSGHTAECLVPKHKGQGTSGVGLVEWIPRAQTLQQRGAWTLGGHEGVQDWARRGFIIDTHPPQRMGTKKGTRIL